MEGGWGGGGGKGVERKLGGWEPEVQARSCLPAKMEIVIVEENHGHRFPQRFFRLENPANDVLPAPVIRMRLAGINDLEVAGVLSNLPETIEIGQDQVCALVSCSTARETDREGLGIKLEAGLPAD